VRNTNIILSMLAAMTLAGGTAEQPKTLRLNTSSEPGKHRTPCAKKAQKPGRNRAATGYDPETKTWSK
jgi:hypothetical protein